MFQSKIIGALVGTALVLGLSACQTRTVPLPKTNYGLSSGTSGEVVVSDATYFYRFANFAAGAGTAYVCTDDESEAAELQDTDVEQGGITLLSVKAQDSAIATCADVAANRATLFGAATQACTAIGRTMQSEDMLEKILLTEDGYIHLPKVCA